MRGARLTPRGQAFLATGVTITVTAMLLGFPDLTRIGVLLTALPAVSLLAGSRRPPPLEVRRSVAPALLAPGQEAGVRLDIHHRGRVPSRLHLAEEVVDPALGPRTRLLLPRMEPGERHTARYRVRGRSRGAYAVGPLVLRQADPFGLTTVRRELPGQASVVVLPRIEQLGDSGPLTDGVAADGPAAHLLATRGEEDVTTRAYREGDDLRRVHWPATAHRGRLMVRQEDHPARRRAHLVLDARRHAHRGTGESSSFEWAVGALASVAVHLSGLGFELVLHAPATATDGNHPLPPAEVLRHLALARLEDDEPAPLVPTAEGGLVVAVVAADPADSEPLARLAAPGRGATGVLLLLDAPAFAAGAAHVGDLAEPARAAGWHTHVVQPGDSVRAAWDSARTDDRVGA